MLHLRGHGGRGTHPGPLRTALSWRWSCAWPEVRAPLLVDAAPGDLRRARVAAGRALRGVGGLAQQQGPRGRGRQGHQAPKRTIASVQNKNKKNAPPGILYFRSDPPKYMVALTKSCRWVRLVESYKSHVVWSKTATNSESYARKKGVLFLF